MDCAFRPQIHSSANRRVLRGIRAISIISRCRKRCIDSQQDIIKLAMTCACKVLLQGDMRCELQVLQPVSTLWGAEFQGQVLKAQFHFPIPYGPIRGNHCPRVGRYPQRPALAVNNALLARNSVDRDTE